jgi:hypothetical protein
MKGLTDYSDTLSNSQSLLNRSAVSGFGLILVPQPLPKKVDQFKELTRRDWGFFD